VLLNIAAVETVYSLYLFLLRKQKDWKRKQPHESGKKLYEGKKKRENARKKKRKRNRNLRRNVNEKLRNSEG
jgi:hypothetical protein